MKRLLLLLISGGTLSASAQEGADRYMLLNVEVGPTLVYRGQLTFPGGNHIRITSGVSAWPSLSVRLLRVTPTWNYGLRVEAAIWADREALVYASTTIGGPMESADLYFASPAIAVAPTISRQILHTKRVALALGVYAGVAFSPHKVEIDGAPSSNDIDDVYLGPSTAFQYGAELHYRYWVKPRLGFSASTGFQRNQGRFNNDSDYGFNINTIPVTVGVSVKL